MIQASTKITRGNDVLCRVLDGEAVLLNLESGTYFGLNKVGTRVWELLEGGPEFETIMVGMRAEFDVEDKVLHADLIELIQQMADKGLVIIQ